MWTGGSRKGKEQGFFSMLRSLGLTEVIAYHWRIIN